MTVDREPMPAPAGVPGLEPLKRLGAAVIDIGRGQSVRAQVKRDALAAFAVRVASAGILYVSQIILARWMGGYEYGLYVFVWTWVLVLGGLAHGGLNTGMMRLVPVYRESGEEELLRGLLLGGRLFAVAASTLVAVTAAVLLWRFQDQISSPYVLPVFLALVCVPMFTLSDVQDGIGRGQAWMWAALLPPYVLRPLILLGSMTVAAGAGFEMTATTAAAGAIAGTWIAALVQLALIQRKLATTVLPGRRRYAVASWLKTSLPLLVIGGCEMLLQNTDVLVVSRYMTPTDVGIYFASAKTMALIMFVHYAVGSAVANRFAALGARGERDELARFVSDAAEWTFWPSLAGAVAILVLGKPLLSLFGPQFVAGYPVMFILVIGFLIRSAMGPAEYLLNMVGEQKRCAAALAVAAVLNLGLNLVLVPALGLIGAATATAIALVTAAALNWWTARRRLGFDISVVGALRRRRG